MKFSKGKSLQWKVKDINLFSHLNVEDSIKIERESRNHFYKKKEIVYSEGQRSIGMYIVRSGKVKLYKTTYDGKQYIIHIAKEGDFLGLSAIFLHKGFFPKTAQLIEDGWLTFIPKEVLMEICQNNPKILLILMSKISSLFHTSLEKRTELAYFAVRERMAGLLLSLVKKHGKFISDGVQIDLDISREEIASMIGTVAETTIRLLKEFKDENMLKVEGKKSLL